MAQDVTLDVGVKVDTRNLKEMKELLEDLKKSAKEVPLGSEQSTKIQKNVDAAEKAFNAGDWDGFRNSVNKVSKILMQVIASTGNVSDSLQKALELKNTLEKQLNRAKERESQIRSKYADESMSHFNVKTQEANFKSFVDEQSAAGKMSKISLSAEDAYKNLQLAVKEAGSFQKITNDIAKKYELIDKKTAGQVSAFNTQQEKIRMADIGEVASLGRTQTDLQSDIGQVTKEIEKLTPASTQASKSLDELYTKIVNLTSALNKNVTTQKVEERRAETQATGGGKATTLEEAKDANKVLDKQQSTLGRVFKQ